MSDIAASNLAETKSGLAGLVDDWSTDKQTYHVPWGKAMMWVFLVSDTFIFTCFLVGYMTVRMSTAEPGRCLQRSLHFPSLAETRFR